MKFALFLLGSWTEPEVSAQSRIFGKMLEQVEYAEGLGFDSIWIAEHHSSRYGICPGKVGKAGLEPARPRAHDPKSCSSANSDTSPRRPVTRPSLNEKW